MFKPETTEYNAYFQKYIDLTNDDELLKVLQANTVMCENFFRGIPENLHDHRYAPEKWTVKQVFMHIIDTERGFAYRAFVSSRGDDQTILYPMDDQAYAANTDVSKRSMGDLMEEFLAVRKASEILYSYMGPEQGRFIARMSNGVISARAMGYIMAGHLQHHVNVIKERYL